jgi:hypothetical protein
LDHYKLLPSDRKLRRKLLDEIPHFTIFEGILYHVWKPDAKNKNRGHLKKRTVIPECLQLEVMKKAHEESGHFGPWKTLELLRERCYWDNMAKDVTEHIQFCEACQRMKPWEMICVDWIGPISPIIRGLRYILMVVDYHTRWVEAFPMQQKDARTFAHLLKKEICSRYMMPKKILSDRDPAFIGKLACSDEWIDRAYQQDSGDGVEKYVNFRPDFVARFDTGYATEDALSCE